MSTFKRLLRLTTAALAPPRRCGLCGDSSAGALCAGCARDLPWNLSACPHCALPQTHTAACRRCARRRLPFDAAWSAFVLAPPVQGAVHGLKYHAQFRHARELGEAMAQALARRAAPLPPLLIPVPLHPLRLMQRGHNQALELARVLAQSLPLRVHAQAAQRLRHTPDQIGLSAAARRRNLRGAFAVTADLRGQHIALLDDVMTTGATLGELARACRAAGATRIEAWSAARTP